MKRPLMCIHTYKYKEVGRVVGLCVNKTVSKGPVMISKFDAPSR
jgi:hypothetical protein